MDAPPRALLGSVGEVDQDAAHQHQDGQHRQDPPARVAQPQRGEARGVALHRAQHGRRLAGRLAGCGRPRSPAPPRGRAPCRRRWRSGSRSPWRWSAPARPPARPTPPAAPLHVGQRLLHVLHRHRHLALGLERDLAREHLEQHDPERVDVGLLGHVAAEGLLGRDVVGGAEHAPGRGQPVGLERAGDPEVGDLPASLRVDQHVLRLHVAVHEALGVGGGERPADLDRVGHGLHDRQAAHAPDPLLQGLALHVLEHDVGRALVLAEVDHGHDMGMGQPGDRARLAPESLELVRVVGDVAMHELDRDPPLQRGVVRAVDRGHAARADLLVEAIAVVELGADHLVLDPYVLWGSDAVRVQCITDPACVWSWADRARRPRA